MLFDLRGSGRRTTVKVAVGDKVTAAVTVLAELGDMAHAPR